MIPASYSVIRYVADPGRNEALNVGIVVWSPQGFRLAIDEDALARVGRQNPHLARGALSYVAPFLERELIAFGSFDADGISRFITEDRGPHLTLTEARYTTLSADDDPGMQSTVDRLITRVVKPVRGGGGGGPTPFTLVKRRLTPLIRSGRVKEGHLFGSSRSGIRRTAEFFVNSNANIALDTLRLSVQRADDIVARADAEAFKVEDVLAKNAVSYVVYCEVSDQDLLRQPTETALQALQSVGARIETNLETATGPLERAALHNSN